ncbi:hypothetical protein [Pedobacter frigoris]|uniref:Uncharacterized protein n=1 Tax=Pedobacter frigoris TaxID=2571272 RepID=A0A4U1CJH7_9SPHI|nr:hypothetical protein [Pedobacter frigoris]TKC06952.1 hypothetical protein FA047_06685 [Pedobacter frigoris]
MNFKTKHVIRLLILLFCINYCYNNFFISKQITGTYLVKNFYGEPFLMEIPYSWDTLFLYKDGRFKSGYYGSGTYHISYDLGGTDIELSYHDDYAGKVYFNTSIERFSWGDPKILLDEIHNRHYEKIR